MLLFFILSVPFIPSAPAILAKRGGGSELRMVGGF
jgi:hypothetical protein